MNQGMIFVRPNLVFTASSPAFPASLRFKYAEIKAKVMAALTECGECTPENVERAMSSKIYDLDDLIDIKEYVRRMEEEQQKKAEQKRGNGRW